MITKIEVENYKSLHKLNLDVGRFNVLIGENGSGKSNILEAITLAAASEANKLDNEFLTSRGIRVTDPNFMRSAFREDIKPSPIKILIKDEINNIFKQYSLTNDNKPYSKWTRLENDIKTELRLSNEEVEYLIRLLKERETSDSEFPSKNFIKSLIEITKLRENQTKYERYLGIEETESKRNFAYSLDTDKWEKIENFVIYSPENTALRNFYKEGQLEPLGINGEGLLKLLKTIRESDVSITEKERNKKGLLSFFSTKNIIDKSSRMYEINASLQLFDWYESLEIPKDLSESEDKVKITDKYLDEAFDQRSTNEGFLFVLFYISLIVSKDTPKIFAIDNIDASLNPKLCTKLITELVRLVKKYNKQVFVTTHNPAVLDGLDLGDDEQRLLVISRNRLGHTRCKRIALKDKPKSSTGDTLKLSEAFLRGYLGGLPKGF